jgi:hypothetical protein
LYPDGLPGRFGQLPPGLKDLRLVGAFKTPTLRALPPRGWYFHDSSVGVITRNFPALVHAVIAHLNGKKYYYADDKLRGLDLPDHDRRAIALFLHALDGKIDPVLSSPPEK